MNCSDFERELETLVELRTPLLSPLGEGHRASCPVCALLWREHAALQAAVQVWRRQTPASDLTERVLAGLQPATRPAPIAVRRHLVLAGSASALAAAAVLVAVIVPWHGAPPVGSVAAVKPAVPGFVPDDVDLTESVVELWKDVQQSTPGLPQASLPSLPHVEGVWPMLARRDSAAPAEESPVTASSNRSSVSTVVRDRVTSAFGFLGQTLPAEPRGS